MVQFHINLITSIAAMKQVTAYECYPRRIVLLNQWRLYFSYVAIIKSL